MNPRKAPLLPFAALAALPLLSGPLLLSALQEKEKEVPFAEFGKGFLKAHGGPAEASELPIEKLREDWCVHAALGGVDVAFPIAYLSEKQDVENLKLAVVSLLEMQAKWIDLLAPDPAKVQGIHADITELENWVKGWKQPTLAFVKPEEKGKDRDIFKVLGATDVQTKAAARLTEFVCKPDALGVAPKEQQPLHILFSPTRRDFVELVGYAGLLDPAKQAELWKPAVGEFTTFWIGWDLVIALEYPPWAPDPQFHTSLPMNKFDKNGIEQHAVQQAANAWQWLCYADDGAPHFHQAIAMSLAIAVCGEINALEGDGWGYGTTGAKTQPYERFVPGGSSAGGTLPPMPAAGGDAVKKGRWREGAGKDHFAGVLRKGQKNGLKALPKSKPEHLDQAILDDKNAHFLIVAPDESTKYVVSAPFFGPDAKLKPYPPTAVILDYREFFRAYKCGFFNWVLTQGDPKDAAASAAKFRELMKKSAESEGEGAQAFDDLVKSIYGVPLSGKDGKTDSLEWRFLDWLAKGH